MLLSFLALTIPSFFLSWQSFPLFVPMDSLHPVQGGSVGCHCCPQVTLWSPEDKLRKILYLSLDVMLEMV